MNRNSCIDLIHRYSGQTDVKDFKDIKVNK